MFSHSDRQLHDSAWLNVYISHSLFSTVLKALQIARLNSHTNECYLVDVIYSAIFREKLIVLSPGYRTPISGTESRVTAYLHVMIDYRINTSE